MDDRYFAGLFDGEGTIGAYRKQYKDYLVFSIRVNIKMVDCALPLIMEIYNQYGGNLYKLPLKENCQSATSIEWLSKEDIEEILSKIEPYLNLKLEQTKLMLWWVRNINNNRRDISGAKKCFTDNIKLMKRFPYIPADKVILAVQEHLFLPPSEHKFQIVHSNGSNSSVSSG